MSQKALLINYEYCTGCHACEVACRNAKQIPRGKWGIKLTKTVFKVDSNDVRDTWEYTSLPYPTQMCDLCADRVAEGKKPACVHHCNSLCMEYGTIEEMAKRATEIGKAVSIFIP